jgi:Peroxisomal membrane protein (Pex16)
MVAAPTCDEPLVLPCTKEEEKDMVVEEYTSHAAVMTRNRNRRSFWDTYQTWARHHQTHLWYWDDAISRLLFFFSSSSSSSSSSNDDNDDTKSLSSSWREIIWGLLELHRLALHHATNKLDSGRNSGDDDQARLPLLFGTTVEVEMTTTTGPSSSAITTDLPSFVPSIRWALTILQTLYPIIHEVVVVASSQRWPNNSITSSSSWKVRRYLERTRFLLRLLLLLQYWNCLPPGITPGLLIRGGGMAVVDDDLDRQRRRRMVTTADQQEVVARQNVQNYVGQRTGKRLFLAKSSTDAAAAQRSLMDNKVLLQLRIKVSELLYIVRPLLYTELLSQQQQQQPSTNAATGGISPSKAWVVAVVLDLISLWGLKPIGNDTGITTGGKRCHNDNHNNNAEESGREWRRRRLRLFLYVLRAPVWDQYTEPIAQRVMGASLRRNVPVVGNLLSSYFWDWLSYWRDYRLEEG